MSWNPKVLAIRDRFMQEENRVMICEEISKILKYAEEFDEGVVTVSSQWTTSGGSDPGTLTRGSSAETGVSARVAGDDGREGCEVGEDGQQWLPF